MNKKKIGAALSLVAAVTAGATAYASTINNLESDKNTNAIFTPDYSDSTYDYNLVKSDYTEDLKNTAIANEVRKVQNTAKQEETVAKVEENAKDILKTTVINIESNESSEEVEVVEETETEEVEADNQKVEAYNQEVIAYDDSKLPEIEEVEEEISTESAEPSNDETKEDEEELDNQEVIAYDDSSLDKNLADQNLEKLEVSEEENQGVDYLDENSKELETEETTIEEANITATKFVNVEALYIRSSKTMEDNSNVIRTLAAGDKVDGVIEGDWLKINEGYLSLKYLSNDYPQNLVDSIEAKKAEELKKAEEAKKALELKKEEARKAKEALELKKEEARKAKEAQEVKKEEAKEPEAPYGTPYTGWVHNTAAVNVRQQAKTGNIIGTLAKGAKVEGEIADGWVKTTYNGKPAFVSAYYLATQEAIDAEKAQKESQAQQAPVDEKATNNQNQTQAQNNQQTQETVVEQVVAEEEIVEEQPQQAQEANQNGQQAANIASQFAGSPYVWGSSNPSVGFDCSGLVAHTYRQLGVSLPHSSQAQFNNGYAVGINNLQPGDLVFFANNGGIDHVGIVTSSDGTFIHASTPRSGVKYDNVYSNYYQRIFAGARRIF